MLNKNILTIIIILQYFFILSCSSIQTSKKQYEKSDERMLNEDYQKIIQQIEFAKGKYYKEKDKVLYYLDMGMLYHWNKDYQKSNEFLDKAEKGIEELFTLSMSKISTSFLLNDNALDYYGEDYEDIYINIFKSINFIHLNDSEAAFIELNRIQNKLNLLETKYDDTAEKFDIGAEKSASEEKIAENHTVKFEKGEIRFHNDVLARYLNLLLYAKDGKWDDTAIDYAEINEGFAKQHSIYNFVKPEIPYTIDHFSTPHIEILSFIGQSPGKKAADYHVRTFQDRIEISSDDPIPFRDEFQFSVEPGAHYKFSIPYMQKRSTIVEKVEVWIDGEKRQSLQIIESLENIAIETFNIKAPIIYARGIIRTVIKGLVSEYAKKELSDEIENPLLSFLAGASVQASVNKSEQADTRISQYFPAKILFGHIAVNEGMHHIKIKYFDESNKLLKEEQFNKEIFIKELNIIETQYLN